MKKLTTLILYAAIASPFALSTVAVAENQDNMQADEKQSSGMQDANQKNASEQRTNEPQFSSKPSSAFYATDVIGSNVKHRQSNEGIGEVKDLIIEKDGRIIGVVVTTSGFLGLGGQDTGLGWDHIEHSMEDEESVFYTDMEEEALRNSPKFERD
ncbi:PRC-barrel domain-containing protein [Halomonas caseinilytica]|uniref:PRC-barrel domain-containing protein n=1 Tax=Halomonas caseinilytica TaxID=438744 RepID=UPI0007E5651E|nr:PRC-barrel domain-containing protein [Halomonas caseinilytica]SEN70324.1 PRC-barrel domain-containing protein [Halomonas caseinilytica]